MSEHPKLDAGSLLRALGTAEVRFVLVGGLASQVHGSPSLTLDVDICYDQDRDNLDRQPCRLSPRPADRGTDALGYAGPSSR